MKNKAWKKPDQIISLGECRICNKEITNNMSFLTFADETRSHITCDKKEYFKKLIEKDK